MRNRIISIISCLLLAIVPSAAQSHSETELNELITRAFELNKQEKHQEAIEAFSLIAENTKLHRTPDEKEAFIMSQAFMCSNYEALHEYQKGYDLAKELLKLDMSDDCRTFVTRRYVVGGYCLACRCMNSENAQFTKARELFSEILPYTNDGEDMRNLILSKIPMAWYFESATYKIKQQYELALSCLEKAAEGFHTISDYKNEISCWYELGSSRENLHDIKGAEQAYKEGWKLSLQTNDATNQMLALSNLRKLYSSIGNINEKLHIEAKMDSLANTNCPPEVAYEYYIFKGDESKSLGMLSMAKKWYQKVEEILPSMAKPIAPRYTFHVKMRDLALKENDLDTALKYAKICHSESRQHFGSSKSHDFLSFMPFIEIYKAKGDSINAQLYVDSLMATEKNLSEPREICLLYNVRGRFYSYFGNFSKALEDFKKADQILATKYGEMDLERIQALPFIGGAENKLKNYVECERYYQEYAKRVKQVYGDESIEYLDAINYLANAEGLAGHIKDGCNHYEMSVEMLKNMTKEQLPYLNTEERETFWKPFSTLLTEMTPFAIEAKLTQDDFTRSCYDALVLSKAFLLESERSLYDILKEKGTSEDMSDLMTVSTIHSQIRTMERDYTSYADSIMALNAKKSMLERKLLDKCKNNGNLTSFMDVDYTSVKSSLSEGDVLIDFTDFVSKSQGRKYAAYIIDKKQNNPLLLPLFAESKIDSMQITRPDMYYEEPYAEDIFNLLWQPFESYVEKGATVYYVPSHILFQIALESLPLPDGSLLGEHYNFIRLSSAREVGKINNTVTFAQNGKSAVLYGGLKYDLSSTEMANEAQQYEVSPLLAMRGYDVLRGDSIYRELKETKKEIETIETCLSKRKINVKQYSGTKGTEESFLNMNSKSPSILHIATHGFYYTPDQAEKIDYLKGYKDAMSLSGLVMSGGNAAWRGKDLPEGVLGGILTAGNIARMDMTGTELVVLSACQTGQGQATSEGLYGLQRAFKKANAQSMIMTLWSVSDVASREFMEQFYKNLSDSRNNWNKRKAFDDAKSYIRKKYPEAYYWASFVMLD